MFGTPAKKSRDRLDNGLLIDVPGIPRAIRREYKHYPALKETRAEWRKRYAA